MQVIKFASTTGFSVLGPSVFCLTLFDRFCSKKRRKFELIVRVSLHDGGLPRWFGLCTGNLNFDFECPRAVRCTWIKWHWKPVHSPYQHPSASCLQNFKKKIWGTGFPVLVMNSQLLFADSLTSTLLDWLGYATGLPVLARLHSHIQLMLESVLSLYFPAVMMLEVIPDELDEQEVVDKPGPR